MGLRTNGFSDQWIVGPMVFRTNGLSDQWAVGPSTWHHINMGHISSCQKTLIAIRGGGGSDARNARGPYNNTGPVRTTCYMLRHSVISIRDLQWGPSKPGARSICYICYVVSPALPTCHHVFGFSPWYAGSIIQPPHRESK